MSYAAFKVVRSPGTIDFCAAAHLRETPGAPQHPHSSEAAEPARAKSATTGAVSDAQEGQQSSAGGGSAGGNEGGRGKSRAAAPDLVLCSSNVVRVMAPGGPGKGVLTTLEHVCEHRFVAAVHIRAILCWVPYEVQEGPL